MTPRSAGRMQTALFFLFFPYSMLLIGISMTPGIWMLLQLWGWAGQSSLLVQSFAIAFGFGFTYFTAGILLIVLCALSTRNPLLRIQPGVYSMHSGTAIRWLVAGALLKLAKQLFLPMVTPSPLNVLYYRLAGSKVGRGAQLNSVEINDPPMLDIGALAVIGGSARINAHSVEKGKFVLAPIVIGQRVTIGAGAIVWGGVTIGDGAVIAARAVVAKDTVVGAGEIWAGMPARFVSLREGYGSSKSQKKRENTDG